jgi:hypothetical protein
VLVPIEIDVVCGSGIFLNAGGGSLKEAMRSRKREGDRVKYDIVWKGRGNGQRDREKERHRQTEMEKAPGEDAQTH